jgi:hypothetical protein
VRVLTRKGLDSSPALLEPAFSGTEIEHFVMAITSAGAIIRHIAPIRWQGGRWCPKI